MIFEFHELMGALPLSVITYKNRNIFCRKIMADLAYMYNHCYIAVMIRSYHSDLQDVITTIRPPSCLNEV